VGDDSRTLREVVDLDRFVLGEPEDVLGRITMVDRNQDKYYRDAMSVRETDGDHSRVVMIAHEPRFDLVSRLLDR